MNIKIGIGVVIFIGVLAYWQRGGVQKIPQPVKEQFREGHSVSKEITDLPDNQTEDRSLETMVVNILTSHPYKNWDGDQLMGRIAVEEDRDARLKMLWELSEIDTSEARAFLLNLMRDVEEDEFVRASVLQALGSNGQQWAYDLAVEMLGSESMIVARAAVQAIGLFGGEEAVGILSELARDFDADPTTAYAAAEALGAEGSTGASKALMDLFEYGILNRKNSAIEGAVAGLGLLDSEESLSYLQEVYDLASDPAVRVLVLEELSDSEGAAAGLLAIGLADPDEDVRASAAWALSCQDEPGLSEQEFVNYLQQEESSGVRTYLYQGMSGLDSVDLSRVWPIISQEADPSAKLAGCQMACFLLQDSNDTLSGEIRRELEGLKQSDSLIPAQQSLVNQLLEGF